jgi:hypothetical protein
MIPKPLTCLTALLGLILAPPPPAAAEEVRGVDPESGLVQREWTEAGIRLRLVQRLPEQTKAFFIGRGFDPAQADLLARSCIFQTVFQNTASGPAGESVSLDLHDWRVRTAQGERPLKLRETWDRQVALQGTPRAARVALTWSLFPTVQRFSPGDHAWGMTSFDLPPGSQFDLEWVWYQGGHRRTATLAGLQCPTFGQPQPEPPP